MSFTTLTLTNGPLGVSEMTKRLVPEDIQIRSTPKLQQLMHLGIHIFLSLSELFDWYIIDCIILSGIGKHLMQKMLIEENKATVQGNFVGLGRVNNYDYTTNSNEAVVCDSSS